MAAKKKTSKADGMTADAYAAKAKGRSAELRSYKRRWATLEAALIDSGVPVSQAGYEAQAIMERAMGQGRVIFPKGQYPTSSPKRLKGGFSAKGQSTKKK